MGWQYLKPTEYVTKLLQRALEKRKHLINESNNAVRLFDGAADGCSGVSIDQYGDSWVVATQQERIPDKIKLELQQLENSVYWKKLSQSEKESPQSIVGKGINEPFIAVESGVKYEINYQAGYSQGIFLDQRLNRLWVRDQIKKGDKVLNTFAYTGAFSVCAALAGAVTTTLDLSQPYLDWGKRNFTLNELDADEHYWCKGDTFHWLDRFARQGRKFDGIILDPPTFSRDAKGKVFRVEKDYGRLVSMAVACLAEGGWLLATTNCRKINDDEFMSMVQDGCPRAAKCSLVSMPEEYCDVPFLKTVRVRL